MKRNVRRRLLAGALILGLTSSAVVFAQPGNGSTAVAPAQPMQSPSYTGSIKLPQDSSSEGAEAATLQSKAKVTMAEAVKTAQTALGTSAQPSAAELGNENGYLVWEVVIGNQAVKVDAGNGQVLAKVGAEREMNDRESGDQHADENGSAQQERSEGGTEDNG